MSKDSFVVVTDIYHAEVSKPDTKDHSFSIEFYGHTTTGERRKVRVVLGIWLFRYLAAELVKIPAYLIDVANDMQKCLRGEAE